ncbi:hypothetical protein MKX01_027480 [Papaver californicum]|nr:hypothetical protein MKX01_027480 [Papaver californicum]
MKECELCEAPARMYCESDQASLCWDCDEKVHCANFLVARHIRSLLCNSCQSPTPWKASGSKLGHTISVCERCVKRCSKNNNNGNDDDDDDEDEESHKEEDTDDDDQYQDADENDDIETDYDDVDETDDEDADNQVVPWSSTPPPPPISSCSSSSAEESSCTSRLVCNGRDFRNTAATVSLPLKRMREKLDLTFHQDEIGCSPSPSAVMEEDEEEATSVISFRPLKDRKVALTSTSTSTTLIGSLKRFEQKIVSSKEIDESSESILAICKLSKDPRAI